jgi:hypothetical protein
MARCILQCLLHGILCCWGILEGPDPDDIDCRNAADNC